MEKRPKKRSGGRSGNSRRGELSSIQQTAWRVPINCDKPTEPIPQEGVEAIHNAAMTILEEIGIEFINEEAKSYLKKAGCNVSTSSDTVKMDRHWVMEMISKAPTEFRVIARYP